MRALTVLAVVLLGLLLLGQVRVGAMGEYTAQGISAWIRLGAIRVRVWPMAPKKKQKPQRPARTRPAAPPEEGAGTAPGGALEYAKALLPTLLEAAGQFRQKLRVDLLRLELRVGSDDPGDAALRYGQASAALGAVWLPLTHAFHVADGTAQVVPDFQRAGMTLWAKLSLSLKLYQILWLGLHFGTRALRGVLAVKRPQSGRQKQRKAV